MSPDEVVEKLKELGVSISRKTVYNWEKLGLIPEATFRNSRTTDYPSETVAEAFASAKLLHKHSKFRLSISNVAKYREMAKKRDYDYNFFSLVWLSIYILILNGYIEAEKNCIIDFCQERRNEAELKNYAKDVLMEYYQKSKDDIVLSDKDYFTAELDAEVSFHILCERDGDCPKDRSEYVECLKNCIFRVHEIKEISYILLDKKELVVYVREEDTGCWIEKQRYKLI